MKKSFQVINSITQDSAKIVQKINPKIYLSFFFTPDATSIVHILRLISSSL